MISAKLTTRHYYDFAPGVGHRTGDIWMNLPTHGLLRCDHCTGLVITPACDLANNKVETITYLPVLPIRSWLCTVAFLPTLRGLLVNLLQQMDIEGAGDLLPRSRTPDQRDIAFLRESVATRLRELGSEKYGELAKRCVCALDHVDKISAPRLQSADCDMLSSLFGKKWAELCEKLIRNSQSTDLHFLPQDGQPAAWSSVPEHSVVLFRYPITSPAEVFDLAQDITISDWHAAIDRLADSVPFAKRFRERRPLKTLSLQTEFLGDLLTRYVGLYIRLGSPDFLPEAVATLRAQIGGARP